jgi:hypothetical protein
VSDGTHDVDDDELPTIKDWVIKETLLDAIVLAAQQKHGIDLPVGDARRLVSFVEQNLRCDPDKTLGPRPFAFFTEDGRFEEIDYMADYITDWPAWTTTLSRNPYPNPFADPPAWLGVTGHLAVRRTRLDGAVTQALRQAGLLSAILPEKKPAPAKETPLPKSKQPKLKETTVVPLTDRTYSHLFWPEAFKVFLYIDTSKISQCEAKGLGTKADVRKYLRQKAADKELSVDPSVIFRWVGKHTPKLKN